MNKFYCYDIEGVKKIGINNWINYNDINLQTKEWHIISRKILKKYLEIFCDNKNKEIYLVAVSNIFIVSYLSSYLYNNYLYNKLKSNNIDKIISKEIYDIDILKSPILIKDIKNKFFINKSNFFKNSKFLIKYNIMKLKLEFYKNYNLRLHRSKEMDSFIFNKNYKLINITPFDTKIYFPDKADKIYLNDKINVFVESILEGNNNLSLKKNLYNEIKEIFFYSYSNIITYSNFFRKYKFNEFFFTASGFPPYRNMISSLKLIGKKSIGFSHGGTELTNTPPDITSDGCTILDKLLLSSSKHKNLYNKKLDKYKNTFDLSNIQYQKNIFDKKKFSKISITNKKIKKVCVLGFPKIIDFNFNNLHYHQFSMLNLEFRLLKDLKKLNLDVTYKNHPERILEMSTILDKLDIKIENNYFAGVIENFDLIIFIHHHTTSFGQALFSNKPMLFLYNDKLIDLDDDTIKTLKSRCKFINTFNSDNKIDLNYNYIDLKNGIEESASLSNFDKLDKFIE